MLQSNLKTLHCYNKPHAVWSFALLHSVRMQAGVSIVQLSAKLTFSISVSRAVLPQIHFSSTLDGHSALQLSRDGRHKYIQVILFQDKTPESASCTACYCFSGSLLSDRRERVTSCSDVTSGSTQFYEWNMKDFWTRFASNTENTKLWSTKISIYFL